MKLTDNLMAGFCIGIAFALTVSVVTISSWLSSQKQDNWITLDCWNETDRVYWNLMNEPICVDNYELKEELVGATCQLPNGTHISVELCEKKYFGQCACGGAINYSCIKKVCCECLESNCGEVWKVKTFYEVICDREQEPKRIGIGNYNPYEVIDFLMRNRLILHSYQNCSWHTEDRALPELSCTECRNNLTKQKMEC